MNSKRRAPKFFLALVAGIAAFIVSTAPASAAGVYADWSIDPSDPAAQNHTGLVEFSGTGLPFATYSSNKSANDGESVRVATGTSTYGDWLTSETPFGAVFGPSGPSSTIQFFRVRIGTSTVSTTTYTFDSPFPANRLGFAFGDIDVDHITLAATDGNGNPVSGANLVGGVFNYCEVTVDVPTTCDGGPYTDPVWTPGVVGGEITPTPPNPGIEEGTGSSAWFRPRVPIKTLTVVFEAYPSAGEPSYRTWFAALDNTRVATTIKPDRKKVRRGKKVKVNVSATTRGPATAKDVKICARIPKGFAVVDSAGAIVTGRKICWTRPTLGPGETARKSFVLRVLGSAPKRPKFSSSADPTNADRATDQTGIEVIGSNVPKPLPPTG